jgi:hypothetical protein
MLIAGSHRPDARQGPILIPTVDGQGSFDQHTAIGLWLYKQSTASVGQGHQPVVPAVGAHIYYQRFCFVAAAATFLGQDTIGEASNVLFVLTQPVYHATVGDHGPQKTWFVFRVPNRNQVLNGLDRVGFLADHGPLRPGFATDSVQRRQTALSATH